MLLTFGLVPRRTRLPAHVLPNVPAPSVRNALYSNALKLQTKREIDLSRGRLPE